MVEITADHDGDKLKELEIVAVEGELRGIALFVLEAIENGEQQLRVGETLVTIRCSE